MKHSMSATIGLLIFFVIAQVLGLFLINIDASVEVDEETGETIIVHPDTVLGERPDLEPDVSFWTIIVAVGIGTLLALLLIKLKALFVWKLWFFLAVFVAISLSLGVIFPQIVALSTALILAILKIFKPNVLVHNISELLIYPGIALLFVPLLNVFWMFVLLIIISIYDAYAVWKSKHMITLAKFQSKSGTFAGLMIPYTKKLKKGSGKLKEKGKSMKIAILGGGDIAFPLLFSGVVMEWLLISQGLGKIDALFRTLIITLFVTISLGILFFKGKADRYYPAMPFLTLGCIVGYVLLLLTL